MNQSKKKFSKFARKFEPTGTLIHKRVRLILKLCIIDLPGQTRRRSTKPLVKDSCRFVSGVGRGVSTKAKNDRCKSARSYDSVIESRLSPRALFNGGIRPRRPQNPHCCPRSLLWLTEFNERAPKRRIISYQCRIVHFIAHRNANTFSRNFN